MHFSKLKLKHFRNYPSLDIELHPGITVLYGHAAENLPPHCGLVVYTVAISEDNPEYTEAQRRGLPCVSRADFLGALMTGYRRRVGVAGMHGKSTCTSMCAQILLDADVDPTILSGATYAPMGGAYLLGDSKAHFLFEACEYMDSFLDFNPTVAILLGAELEHVDYFKSMEQIRTSFAAYASLTGAEGVTVVNADDSDAMESAHRALASGGTGRLCTFSTGDHPNADFMARHIRTERGLPVFELVAFGESLGEVKLAVPGRHQVINALAAAALAIEAGATLSNMEEWQYGIASTEFRWNLSGTYQQVIPRYLSVDPDGNEREFLYDALGEEALGLIFLKGYQWPFDTRKLDGSSKVDILVAEQIKLGRRVYLDFTLPVEIIKWTFE